MGNQLVEKIISHALESKTMNKEQILNMSNFTDFTSNQVVEMLRVLQLEIKTLRHNRDYEIENLRHTVATLDSKLMVQESEIKKYRELIQRYLQLLEKPLTIKERLKGKKIV